jgi:hypothetical protein
MVAFAVASLLHASAFSLPAVSSSFSSLSFVWDFGACETGQQYEYAGPLLRTLAAMLENSDGSKKLTRYSVNRRFLTFENLL